MYQSKKTEILKTYTKRITTPLWNKCQNAGNIYEFIIGLLTCATNVDLITFQFIQKVLKLSQMTI